MGSAEAEPLKRAILGLGLGGNRNIKVGQGNTHSKQATDATTHEGCGLYGSETSRQTIFVARSYLPHALSQLLKACQDFALA